MEAVLLHKYTHSVTRENNHRQSYVKKVFSKFSKLYDKYQRILQQNRIYIIKQKEHIFNKLDKNKQIKHLT